MTTPNNGGAAKATVCLLCGRTEGDDGICLDYSGICEECCDECDDDQSWGAHEDAY